MCSGYIFNRSLLVTFFDSLRAPPHMYMHAHTHKHKHTHTQAHTHSAVFPDSEFNSTHFFQTHVTSYFECDLLMYLIYLIYSLMNMLLKASSVPSRAGFKVVNKTDLVHTFMELSWGERK